MNEFPELKHDFAFLKKIDSQSKVWKELDGAKTKKSKTNFLLHPKRLESDSNSTVESTPRFFSGTVLKNLEFPENTPNPPEKGKIGDSSTKTVDIKSSSKPRLDNFGKKFKTQVERSLTQLTKIRLMIEAGIPEPDGEEDYFRRVKRLQEFLARFSRIYLYPLMRQTDELTQTDKKNTTVINQKLLYSQQIVLQALQAYYSHLPCSVDKCGSDKLKTLLDQILYLCHLYEELKKGVDPESWEFVDAMRNHVQLLSEALTTFDLKFVNNTKKLQEKKLKPELKKPVQKNKSKLSMYVKSSFRKDLALKKQLEALTTKKLNVKSRYKTAGFKHRPPVEKQVEDLKDRNKMKFFQRSSSYLSSGSQRRTPFREDDIKTMVEVEDELEAPPNSGENVNHESNASCRQLVQDSTQKPQNADSSVEKALQVLRKFLESSENGDIDILRKIVGEAKKNDKKKIEPVVTVTGAKNAKLICIRDDNSVEEDCGYEDKEIMTDVELKVKSSETQTEVEKTSKKTIKISRLPRHNVRLLQLLPKDYAINIIQYKLRYNQFHKYNPMYRKSAHIQPWVLMGKISDEILDYIIRAVTSELEVDEILENLYNAEFQY